MRSLAVAIVALLLLAPLAVAAGPLVHRQRAGVGWHVESFTTPSSSVVVDVESVGRAENHVHLIHLYDSSGRLLRGVFATYQAGNDVDVAFTTGAADVTTDTLVEGGVSIPRTTITLSCNAACNPSRDFRLLVVVASDSISSHGFALHAGSAAVSQANTSGPEAFVATSHEFDGLVAHAGAPRLGAGTTFVSAGRHTMQALDTFVGAFVKFGPATSTARLALDTPVGSRTCSCVVGFGAAGSYVARLDDVETGGREAFMAWADVEFP